VAAPTLRSLAAVAAERRLKLGEVLGVLRDSATALGALHAAGHAHGAVCAENIVLDDAGAARLCRDSAVTPHPSPEVVRGEPPDARSDVFSLGATMAELLADAPSVPDPIARLLATMTAGEPERRARSMDEVLTGLEACELMTGFVGFRPGHEADVVRSRKRLFEVVVVVLGLVVLGLAALAILGRTPAPSGTPPESYEKLIEKKPPGGGEESVPGKH